MSEVTPGIEVEPDPNRYVPSRRYAHLEYLLFESEQRVVELQQENSWLAHDQLTGVHVDKIIRNELEAWVERAKDTGDKFTLIIGDVDNMKYANTTYGHHAGGDALLAAVGRSCRQGDLIGRAGGDEIWWIASLEQREQYLSDIPLREVDPSSESLASRIAEIFEQRADSEISKLNLGHEVGFSAGYAVYNPGDASGDMIWRASESMHQRKERNKELRGSINRHPSGPR
ncbi:MAG: GGDEF domain-containing protein [Candidatus Saccharimonadales bacterium]